MYIDDIELRPSVMPALRSAIASILQAKGYAKHVDIAWKPFPGNYIGYSDSCWELAASDGPYQYAAIEPVLRADNGKITPTGAISSFPYTPRQSMKALGDYYYNYGHFLWGEFGFRDACNLTDNWCLEIYMGLNQAPMAAMIENYRTGLLRELFMSDPEMKKAVNKIKQNQ